MVLAKIDKDNIKTVIVVQYSFEGEEIKQFAHTFETWIDADFAAGMINKSTCLVSLEKDV